MPTILVIDDEPDIRDLIRMNLELGGFEVTTAADGPEGIAAAGSAHPDAIILDVMMPGLDGWEVLTRLKAMGPPTSQVPVIMLTARSGELDRVRGAIEGAVRHLTKPFSPVDLVNTVKEILAGAPEPVQRRLAQRRALSELARIETGSMVRSGAPAARPHLTRLDGVPASKSRPDAPMLSLGQLATLSTKQQELIAAVAASPTVMQAAGDLSVSRSNVYASLRRIARKLGVATVSDLVRLARTGGLR